MRIKALVFSLLALASLAAAPRAAAAGEWITYASAKGAQVHEFQGTRTASGRCEIPVTLTLG
ncbi:hypothetical protein ACTG9Q_27175 [Actinokineospora sp. 24-640]